MILPEIISFDCYGTLVDWKKGVLNTLLPFFDEFLVDISGEEIYNLFIKFDREIEMESYIPYREVLSKIIISYRENLNLNIPDSELNILSDALPEWPLFDDTKAALIDLKKYFKLSVISNVDNELFKQTNDKLSVEFDFIITAEDLKSYKPSLTNFKKARELYGVSPAKHWHVAQSIYHDIIPCIESGISTCWINRYKEPGLQLNNENLIGEFKNLREFADFLINER